MPVNISDKMNNWIAQSGSLNSFYDFRISSEQIAKYTILGAYDDFYISLYCKSLEALRGIEDVDKESLLSLGKGFELFARKNVAENFGGINPFDAMVLAAVLKYVAGYSSSSRLLIEGAKGVEHDSADSQLIDFLSAFLSRDLDLYENDYFKYLRIFLRTGNPIALEMLVDNLNNKTSESIDTGPVEYFVSMTSKVLAEHFIKNNIWNTLLSINDLPEFWSDFVKANVNNGIWDFFPSQLRAIEKGLLSSEKSFALQMPTSSGKTSLCEAVIYYHVKSVGNAKVVLLAPFRALASELKLSMGRRLKPYGIKVKALYGGNVPTSMEQESIENADLIIATPEKMMAIEDVMPNLLEGITLVICDEGHLLDDDSRGLDYELFLTRLKVVRGDKARFIYLSAIVPNLSEVNFWLGGDDETSVSSEYRPTTIDIAYLKAQGRGKSKYKLDVNPHKNKPERYDLYNFLTEENYKYRNPKTKRFNTYKLKNSQKRLTVACALKSVPAGTTAVFCPTKKGKIGVAAQCEEVLDQIELINEYGLAVKLPIEFADSDYVNTLTEYLGVVFSQDYLLKKCVENGFAYHHGSLPQYIREIIEDGIRREKIKLVVCTNTLAEGVNLPLRVLILNSTTRYYNGAHHNISTRDLKNLIGRVGRAGKELSGFVIAIREADQVSIKQAITDDRIKPIKGYLYQVITHIHQELSKHQAQLSNAMLDGQVESFLNLVDSIDSAIIDLVDEGVDFDDINEMVLDLVQNTFSYSQLDDEQKGTMSTLFSLRAEKLSEEFTPEQFSLMKRTGTNFRVYSKIQERIDFEDEIWAHELEYDSWDWLEYIFEGVANISNIEAVFDEEYGDKNDIEYDDVKGICLSWISGESYSEIASDNDLEIDTILDVIHDFIGYRLAMTASQIIRTAEQQRPEEAPLSESFIQWITSIQNGFYSTTHYHMFQLGFSERIGLLRLGDAYIERYGRDDSEAVIRGRLINNFTSLLEELSEDTPQIVLQELKKNYEYIAHNMW